MPIFLFTDIEGSTKKWDKYPEEMKKVLSIHDAIIKKNIEIYGGRVIKHTGDGVFAVFDDGKPLSCAIEIQKGIERENWGEIGELRIRIGLHAGSAEKRDKDYFGPVINRTARVMDTAWGGQIILTPAVSNVTNLPDGAFLKDAGVHILKDLGEPQQIYWLVHRDLKIQEFPPLRSLSAHPNNLPIQPTAFLGREDELVEITKLLENSSCRLLTIIGPGGIGKTRLAIQTAAEKIEDFADGVYFIPLAPLSSADSLISSIAKALNFSFYSQGDEKGQLLNFLREKEHLLIMDNFEHLVEGAGFIADILNAAPKVNILVTSREALNLKGEWLIQIEGMEVPEDEAIDIEGYSAVQLFLHNAQRANLNISFSEEDKHSLVRICQLVGGMPLGIEIASSWLRTLSCKEIAQEIEKNLDFLTTSIRDIPERHRSLRAVFDYSWELLSEEERSVFTKISVFRGGFTREAGEQVAGISLPILTALIDKSLLCRNPSGRYHILEVVRQYALKKLNENLQNKKEVQELYCRYYADFIQRREEQLKSGELSSLGEIRKEIENIRTGWSWAVENKQEEQIEKSLVGLYNFYDISSWFKEGERKFKKAAKVLESQEENIVYGKILGGWGSFCFRLGSYEEARELFRKSLTIFRNLNAQNEIPDALKGLGNVAHMTGEYDKAKKLYKESLAIYKENGNQRGIASTYNNLGNVHYRMGKYKEARELYKENLAIRKEIGDQFGMAAALNNLGIVADMLTEYQDAKKLYQESLALKRELGDHKGIAMSLYNLSFVAKNLGETSEEKQLCQESLSIFKEIGHQMGIIHCFTYLGNVSFEAENYSESKEYFYEALRIATDIQTVPMALESLTGIAKLLMKKGQKEQSLELLTFILHHPSCQIDTKENIKKSMPELESEFSAQKIKTARKKGKTRKLEEVVEEVMGEHD